MHSGHYVFWSECIPVALLWSLCVLVTKMDRFLYLHTKEHIQQTQIFAKTIHCLHFP